MSRASIPNFRGLTALVLHAADEATSRLERQLERLGVACRRVTGEPAPADFEGADVVFFDGDTGYDALFPWTAGAPPVPLVALLASEAPGRLEWVMAQGATALMHKPLGSSGAYAALVVAFAGFEREIGLRRAISDLSARLAERPAVVEAAVIVMQREGVDVAEAMKLIRRTAMTNRATFEATCRSIVAAGASARRKA